MVTATRRSQRKGSNEKTKVLYVHYKFLLIFSPYSIKQQSLANDQIQSFVESEHAKLNFSFCLNLNAVPTNSVIP